MRRLLLLLLCLLTFSGIYALEVIDLQTGTKTTASQMPSIKRSVQTTTRSIVITYELDSLAFISDDKVPGAACLAAEGLTFNNFAGQAQLPARIERFRVEKGMFYSCTIKEEGVIEYDMEYSPARTDDIALVGETEEDVENRAVTPIEIVDKFMPEKNLLSKREQGYKGDKFVTIAVTPVKYNSTLKKARIARRLTVRILFDTLDSEENQLSEVDPFDPMLSALTVSNNSSRAQIGTGDFAHYWHPAYLILCPLELRDAGIRMYEWKLKHGYDVKLIDMDFDSFEAVWNKVRFMYNQYKNISYLLIIGDDKLIPVHEHIQIVDETPAPYTDMLYANPINDYDIPALYYGRIPASNLEEANNAIDKIIAYEEGTDLKKTNNYNTIVCAAQFQGGYGDGKETRDFVRTTETVSIAAENKMDNVQRYYAVEDGVVPRFWRSPVPIVNLPIPKSAYQGFENGENPKDIMDEFYNGAWLVLHRDHGVTEGWSRPEFKMPFADNMFNDFLYPVVFSVDCLVGDFKNPNNFSKRLLCKKDAGIAGTIAASVETCSQANDAFTLGMFSTIWPDENLDYFYNTSETIDDGITRMPILANSPTLGQIMNIGFTRMEEAFPNSDFSMHNRLSYFCLGDPGMHVYWNNNLDIKEYVKFTFKEKVVEIDTKPLMVEFSVNQGLSSAKAYGNHFEVNLEDAEFTYVTFHADGALPYGTYIGDVPGAPESIKARAVQTIKIESCGIDSNGLLNVSLTDCPEDDFSIDVVSTQSATAHAEYNFPVSEKQNQITIPSSEDRLFHIVLKHRDKKLDYKTILKSAK